MELSSKTVVSPPLGVRGRVPSSRAAGRIGFAFSTKDRVEFTRRSLASLDTCGGFDLVWVDGSETPEAKVLPESTKLQNCRLVEVHHNVKGGPDAAIRFGLQRLLDLGYGYCGLIENDMRFKAGWFPKLMELFEFGAEEGLNVGAATVFSLESRVMIHRPRYAFMWNMGACMVLFTREGARVVLATYKPVGSGKVAQFYSRTFGVDLGRVWELMMDQPDRGLGCDWAYAMYLYKNGMVSLGTVPSMAVDTDHDIEKQFRTTYVQRNVGPSAHEHEEETHRRLLGAMADRRFGRSVICQVSFIADYARSRAYWKTKQCGPIRAVYRVLCWLAKGCRSLGTG